MVTCLTFLWQACHATSKGCQLDLDDRTGRYPPFILNELGHVTYPTGARILKFGTKYLVQLC